MKLLQVQDKKNIALSRLPNKWGKESGYLIIALVEDNKDIYVAFTDYDQSDLWIEKYIAPFIKRSFLCFEDLKCIEDNKEFVAVRNFLVKKRIL